MYFIYYIGEWYLLIISFLLAVAVEFLDWFQKFITPLWEEKKLPIHTHANKHADEYAAIGVNKRFNINVVQLVYYVIGFLWNREGGDQAKRRKTNNDVRACITAIVMRILSQQSKRNKFLQ